MIFIGHQHIHRMRYSYSNDVNIYKQVNHIHDNVSMPWKTTSNFSSTKAL